MCAVAAAGLHSERLRGGRGSPDSQTDPQRSPRLQSCKYASSCGVTGASLSRFLLKQNLLNKLNRIKSSCFGSVNQKNGSVVCLCVLAVSISVRAGPRAVGGRTCQTATGHLGRRTGQGCRQRAAGASAEGTSALP